jgi:hypothetical protein
VSLALLDTADAAVIACDQCQAFAQGSDSDEAIHVSASCAMDCFAEPVIGRALSRDPLGRNDKSWSFGATKQPDGQITKSLSIPCCKNIPLNASGKSVILIRASHPKEGRVAIVTNVAVRCGGR